MDMALRHVLKKTNGLLTRWFFCIRYFVDNYSCQPTVDLSIKSTQSY
jgi:hypothetical protein